MVQYRAVILVLVCIFAGGVRAGAQTPLDLSGASPEVRAQLFQKARAMFMPDGLDQVHTHRVLGQAICGTPVVAALAANWHTLSKATQESFAVLFQRSNMQRSVISASGHFKIHYDLTGFDAVVFVDGDGNGIPDYVDEVARTYDRVWMLEIDEMGYREPVADSDGIFDVYIRELGQMGAYGLTYPIALGNLTTTSYMEIDNNYTDNIYATSGLNGLRVTVAHEFFHPIQFAYYARDITWWHEASATWVEDVAYDDVNDYYQYDDGFFADPTISLDRATSGSDSHQYGASIYAHYLEQVYGRDSIRRSWEQLGKSTARRYDVQEFNASMPTGGYAGVMPGFAVWNYFTGTRHRAGFYEEGAQYNTMKATTVALSSSGATGSGRMDHLGAEYLRVATSSLSPGTGLRAAFTLGTGGVWDLIVLLVKSDRIEMLRPSGAQVEIGNVSQYTEIVFIPIAKALSGSRFTYSYTITPITSTDGQTRPLALAINGTGVPVVVMDQAVSTAKVVAAGAGAGESLTWSVVRTSGDLAVSVSGQTNLSSFQTTSSSIDLVAAGNGWATVEIAVRGAGSTVSLISAVFNQPPPQNLPPVFTPITTRTVNEGAQLSFVVEATDSDGDALTYSVTSMPEGAQFTGQTFRWTPGSTQGGSAYEVVFVASDGTEQTSMTVRIEVADVNQPVSIQKISPERPVVVGGMGDTLRFSVTAVDPDHDPVNYSWTFNEISLAENGSSVLVTVSVGETDDTVQVAVSSGSVELVQRWTIGKALKGDFNGDGRVSFGDFVLFAGAYGKTLNTPGFEATYDLNSNETVDFSDFVIFVQYYGLP